MSILVFFIFLLCSGISHAVCPQYTEDQVKTISDTELKAQKFCLANLKTENEYLLHRVNQLYVINDGYCEKIKSFEQNCILMSRFQSSTRKSCDGIATSKAPSAKFTLSTSSGQQVKFRVVIELFSSPTGFVFQSQEIETGSLFDLNFKDILGGVLSESPPLAMARQIYFETISGESFPLDFVIGSFQVNGRLLFDEGSVAQKNGSKIKISLNFIDDILSTNQSCLITNEEIEKLQKDTQEAVD
ncbi:MAG: hypothetical protein AB8C84_10770 [Oligoflexales bacterium]